MRWSWPARQRTWSRRARRFAEMLDADRLPDSPNDPDAELAALVGALHRVGAGAPGPTDQFRSDLRDRLVAEASAALVRPAAPARRAAARRTPAQRRLVRLAAAIAAGGVLATAGTAVASTRALPGQALYGVKLGLEQVQLSLTWGDLGRGERYLGFASTRLDEVTSLVTGADATRAETADLVATALGDQAAALRTGAGLLVAGYRQDGNPAALQALTSSVTDQQARLAAILRLIPPQASGPAQEVANLLAQLSRQGTALLAACGQPCGAAPTTADSVAPAAGSGPGSSAVTGASQPAGAAGGSAAPGGASASPGSGSTGTGAGSVGSSGGSLTGIVGSSGGSLTGTLGGVLSPSPLPSPLLTTTLPSVPLSGATSAISGLLMPATATSSPSPSTSTGTSTTSTCLLASTCLP